MAGNWWESDAVEGAGEFWAADALADAPESSIATDEPQEVVTSARAWRGSGAGRGGINDPRRLDAPREEPAKTEPSFASQVVDNAAKLVRGVAATNPVLGRLAQVATVAEKPKLNSVLEGQQMPGTPFDAAETERLSRRDYAEAREQEQRVANSPEMRAPRELIPGDRQAFAERNPVTAGFAQSAASTIAGTLNAPAVVTGLAGETANRVAQSMGVEQPAGRVPNMPLVNDLQRIGQDYASQLSRKSPGKAWDDGDFGRWMLTQLSGNSFSAAQSLGALFVPGAQASLLASMGAVAGGNAYAQGDSASAATLKGLVEVGSEMLPLKAAEKIKDVVLAIPSPARNQVLAEAGKRLLAAGTAVTTNSMVGAIEEVAAEIGGNAIDKFVSGKDKNLFEDVDRAAIVGAAFGTGFSAPAVAEIAAGPQAMAARELAGTLQGVNFDPAATERSVMDSLRTEPIGGNEISPVATANAAAAAERARLEQMRSTASQAKIAVARVKEDAVAEIGQAATVDEAIQAATRAVSIDDKALLNATLQSAGVDPAELAAAYRPAAPPVAQVEQNAPAAQAVDNIQQLLAPAAQQAASQQPTAETRTPIKTWSGRRGDGYATPSDAERGLNERQRLSPDLTWAVEQTPDGRFRLAGYEKEQAAPVQNVEAEIQQAEQKLAATEQPMKMVRRGTGTLAVTGGDVVAMQSRLQAAGITDSIPITNGFLVSKRNAAQAEALLRTPAPVEAPNVQVAPQPAATTSPAQQVQTPEPARVDAAEPTGIPAAGAGTVEATGVEIPTSPTETQVLPQEGENPAVREMGSLLVGADPAQLLYLARNQTTPLGEAAAAELRRRETDAAYRQRDDVKAAEEAAIVEEARDQQAAQAVAQSQAQELEALTAMAQALERARQKTRARGQEPQFSREPEPMSMELAQALMAIKPRARATKESVKAAIKDLVNGFGILPQGLGKIVVANASEIRNDWEPLIGPVAMESEDAGRAQGFYDPKTKTIFLIPEHIRAGDEIGVVAHELMHKHGEAVLGAENWMKLHSAIGGWANAKEGSQERQVYDEAAARVESSGPELSTQELFPYAVQVALEMGVKPNLIAPKGTVARWLGQVRLALRQVWDKITRKPELFNAQDLVNLAFGIAQRENPAHTNELDNATQAVSALEELSGDEGLFALPKSDATTIDAIAADADPGIVIRQAALPGDETLYTLVMPDGTVARITERKAQDGAVYGMDDSDGGLRWITKRPGENAESMDGKDDVWLDVSGLKPGKWGGVVYNITANYAYNTGKVFIGDPSGLSDMAMRRRAEQMLSSALKFGTTEHLAPHPRQVEGDASIGVPPLRWVYGDHEGNIARLIDVNVRSLDNAFPNSQNLSYDLDAGTFRNTATGRAIGRAGLNRLLERSLNGDSGGEAGAVRSAAGASSAGWRTVARGAVFRAILARWGRPQSVEGQGSRGERGQAGSAVLDQAVPQPDQSGSRADRSIESPGGILADLADQRSVLGARDREDRIFYSRGADESESAEPGEESPQSESTLRWRDATGQLQFAPGEWLYNKMGDAASPLLVKLGLKAASPELRRQLRQMKLQVEQAQELAAKVATEAGKLSQEERDMVSDIVEQDLRSGVVPPQHAIKLAGIITNTMEQQTNELIELGMLTEETAERWRGTYLPRFYESKLKGTVTDLWADAMKRLVGRTKVMGGIKGKHLKGRGMFETIPASDLDNYQALGWEVRDPDFQAGESKEVQVWRDFTREEREKMGEIRDSGFRFVMGYLQTQKDIALGRMFQNLSENPEFSSRLPTEELSVRVPDTKVNGTGAHVYGKLAGMYVSQETLSHLSSFDEVHNDTLQMYRKAMSLWKEGKTVLNPVAHMNNVVSNLTMAHLAGISYHRGDKYLGAIADFVKGSPMIEDAKAAGLFLGSFNQAELVDQMPQALKELAKLQDSTSTKLGRTAMNIMTMWMRAPMGKAYEFEDSFFKYLIYKDARNRGMDQQDAVDYAQRYIFTYDDLPKGARNIRDYGIPFFAYTYKAVPALLHTALTHPVRMATPAGLLWAITAIGYAFAADGDDDTPWTQLAAKYFGDEAFRAKVAELKKYDQSHLPVWMRGYTAFFTPKTIRVGFDKTLNLPVFMDISRFIPGGDLFDVSPNAGGLPLPQPITPNHPILTMAMGLLGNKDLFSGKDLTDKNDTKGEATEKRLTWIYRQAAPAISVGQYHWNRSMEMVAQASGGEINWLPEYVSERYTGIGTDGLPVQPKYAVPQTFGIKIRPMDQDKAEAIERALDKKMLNSINAELAQLRRLNQRGVLSDKSYEKQRDYQEEKKDRIRSGKTVDGDAKE